MSRLDESAEAYYASVIGICARGSAQENNVEVDEDNCVLEVEERGARVHHPINGPSKREPEASEDIPDEDGQHRQQGIGYQLLRRAGWKGSGGLGAQEQGIASPISAWKQSGRQGIGSQSAERQKRETSEPVPHSYQDASSKSMRVGEEPPGETSRRAPKREWESVRVEEPVDVKVKRWRQVMQAEADEQVSKAIDRYMFRAFRDDESDTNPLLRRNNLSLSNPLL